MHRGLPPVYFPYSINHRSLAGAMIFFAYIWKITKKDLSLQTRTRGMRRPQVVKLIQETIHTIEPTATTILYGSEARGDARAKSDIDLLILLEGNTRDIQREDHVAGALYNIELATGVLISPMIMLRKQWEERPFKTPFYINVMNEGITL